MSMVAASRYANALVEIVLDPRHGLDARQVAAQLHSLEDALSSSADLRNVILSPAVPLAAKYRVMDKIAAHLGLDRVVRNFVFVVIRKRRGNLFSQIRRAYENSLYERMGILRANVTSAFELSSASRGLLESQLARLSGHAIECRYSVDPELIGGVQARIGSKLYDGSVKGQLEALRRKLAAGA